MSFWGIVLVVLLILWLFGGLYIGWPAQPNQRAFAPILSYTIIPWACVAILTYIVLTGTATVVVPR